MAAPAPPDLMLDRLQAEQDRGERLPGLVVQLAREALPLEFLAFEQRPHRLAADPLGELERDAARLAKPCAIRMSASEKRVKEPALRARR